MITVRHTLPALLHHLRKPRCYVFTNLPKDEMFIAEKLDQKGWSWEQLSLCKTGWGGALKIGGLRL